MHRIGIAGFGFMGQFHYRAYGELPGARVVALYDPDPKVFERAPVQGNLGTADVGDLRSVGKFTDLDRFLADDFDILDVCAPTSFHRPLAEAGLEGGRAVLVEKPMALSVGDCDALLATARRTRRPLMVAQCIRFWPGYDHLLEAIRDGRYGRPLSATLRRIGGTPSWSEWFLDAARSGGGILDCLVHDFDFARAAFGRPDRISAAGTQDVLGARSGVAWCRADLRYSGGPRAVTIEGGWVIGAGFPFSMSAIFQFQEATVGYGIEAGAPLTIYPRGGGKKIPALAGDQGYVFELRYFLDCLDAGKPFDRCPPEESRDAIAIAIAARDSAIAGAPVDLE
jgi:predicted dehydrogenase